MSTDATDDNNDSILEDYTSTNSNSIYSNSCVSDPLYSKVAHADHLPAEQTNYEMEQVRNASNGKDNIIKILQEQLNTLHRKHKETIDETESVKYKYNHALDELEDTKKINAQLLSEVKKYESGTKESSLKTQRTTDDKLNDPNLQGIAVRIADVKGKVKEVKQFASDSDMPANVQEDIDQMNIEFKNLLKQQYNRIEDILTEHSSILDKIKAKVSGSIGKESDSKIRFSLPNIPVHPVRPTFDEIVEGPHRQSSASSKVSLVSTLRQTNDILTEEINDLRRQLVDLKRCIHVGAEEFIEDVIETAKLNIQPAEMREGHYGDRSEMKSLHEMNNLLRVQNRQLKEELVRQQKLQQDADEREALSVLHDEMKRHLSSFQDINMAEEDLSTTKTIIKDLKIEIQNQRDVIRQREDTIDELESEFERLNTTLGHLTNEQSGKQTQFHNSVDSNLRISSERLDTLKEQIDRISVQKQDAEILLQKTIREKDSMTRNMTVMSNTMQQYKNELEVKQAECAKYKERMQRLEEQTRSLDQEMTEKDQQHEIQIAKNKTYISDMEGKCRTSREEMEGLRETSQKLMALKSINERLADEVEQLSMELEKFKGFECKDQLEMDKQMQNLQCFCKKLEEKLDSTKAQINYTDSKKYVEIKQHLKEKAILETQTTVQQEEIMKQRENSQNLLSDIDNYKSVIKDLSKTIQDMRRELDEHNVNVNCSDNLLKENDNLKEEMRERNCEVINLRRTLDEYNRSCPAVVSPVSGHTCRNVACSANQTQMPPCQQSACAMRELRKLTDDMKNTQSKISNIVNSNQEFADLLQHQRNSSQQWTATAATVNLLNGLRNRVENLNQKEQELQYLLNELQRQNNKLIEFNHKRNRNDVEIGNRLASFRTKKEEVEAIIKGYQHTQNDLSRTCRKVGNDCYANDDESVPFKTNHHASKTRPKEAVPSLANDPVFSTYQNQLEEAVTKYKHVDQADKDLPNILQGDSPVEIELPKAITSPPQQTESPHDRMDSLLIRTNSIDTTRSQMARRRTIPMITPIDVYVDTRRPSRVVIKKYHDQVMLYNADASESEGEDAGVINVDLSMFQRLQSPIPIYSKELQRMSLEPLQFNTFYAKIPSMMYTQRIERKLAVSAEYNYGDAMITGGPLKCPYKLWQMHFHWGDNDDVGSEHSVNDKHFVMEMHAIHIKKDATPDQAIDDPDGFATITYLFSYSPDEDDIAMSSIILNFQRFDLRPDDTILEFQSYFPLDLLIRPFDSGYVTYRGSRTDGSNTENVIWIIAPSTNQISRLQMQELRELKSQLCSVRPMQQTYDRIVIFAEATDPDGERKPSLAIDNLFLPIKGS